MHAPLIPEIQRLEAVEMPQERLPASWKFAAGVLAGAAVVMVGLVAREITPVVTQAFVAPTTTSFAGVRPANVRVWAVPADVPEVDEVAVAEAAAEAAVEEEEEEALSPKDIFDGQKTYYPKLADTLPDKKVWYSIDAEGLRLGRMASEVAKILRGNNKITYHPAMDMGDYVIIYNAEKVKVSGNKDKQKLYRRHVTGRPGTMKVETFDQLQARIPERIIEKAVKGMLPKGILGRQLFRHLKVYKGPAHPHDAQNPIEFKFEGPTLEKVAQPVTRGKP